MKKYKKFSDFENDLKIFHQFLKENGPKYTVNELCVLEFLFKKILEVSSYFIENLENEIELQKVSSFETKSNFELEIKNKEETLLKKNNSLTQKIKELEKNNNAENQKNLNIDKLNEKINLLETEKKENSFKYEKIVESNKCFIENLKNLNEENEKLKMKNKVNSIFYIKTIIDKSLQI